jgi:hypothetical protein
MATEPLDPESHALRPLAEYAARLPSSRHGKRLNRATLWRWALKGVRGGRRLHTVALGYGRMTCDAWVWEFMRPANPPPADQPRCEVGDRSERERTAAELGLKVCRRGA